MQIWKCTHIYRWLYMFGRLELKLTVYNEILTFWLTYLFIYHWNFLHFNIVSYLSHFMFNILYWENHDDKLKLVDHLLFYLKMRHGMFFTTYQICCDLSHQCPSGPNGIGFSFHSTHFLLFTEPEWEGEPHYILNWEVHTWSHWSPRQSLFPAQRTAAPGAWRWPPHGASESSPSAYSSHPWPDVEGRNPK